MVFTALQQLCKEGREGGNDREKLELRDVSLLRNRSWARIPEKTRAQPQHRLSGTSVVLLLLDQITIEKENSRFKFFNGEVIWAGGRGFWLTYRRLEAYRSQGELRNRVTQHGDLSRMSHPSGWEGSFKAGSHKTQLYMPNRAKFKTGNNQRKHTKRF